MADREREHLLRCWSASEIITRCGQWGYPVGGIGVGSDRWIGITHVGAPHTTAHEGGRTQANLSPGEIAENFYIWHP